MDIKEFVSKTLKEIVNGVKDAQNEIKDNGAIIVPHCDGTREIKFDIAVTVVEGKESEAKAGISVWSIGAGVNGKMESSNSIVSRINFVVPVELPKGEEEPPVELPSQDDIDSIST